MAQISLNLSPSFYQYFPNTNSSVWNLPQGNRLPIPAALSPSGQTRLLSNLSLGGQTGQFQINFEPTQTSAIAADLSGQFETTGFVVLSALGVRLVIQMAGQDTTDPYSFIPPNSADLIAASTALGALNPVPTVALKISDGVYGAYGATKLAGGAFGASEFQGFAYGSARIA